MAAGPSSLMAVAEEEVLGGLLNGFKQLESPFCVGGSLGRIAVHLAVAAPEGGGSAAQTLELPGGGQDALDAMLEACEPAVFGKGKETGGCAGGHQRSGLGSGHGCGKRGRVPPGLLLPRRTRLHPSVNPAKA